MSEIAIPISIVDRITGPLETIANKVEQVGDKAEEANNKSSNLKTLATSFNNIATAGMALYGTVDRVDKAMLSADKAATAASAANLTAEKAQTAYADAVAQFGSDSEQARGKLDELNLANERAANATEMMKQKQDDVTQSMVSGALTVIPSVITLFTSMETVTNSSAIAHDILNKVMHANPAMLVVAGIMALVAILILAYNTCEPFRNAVNSIADVLRNTFGSAVEWVIGLVNQLGSVWETITSGIKAIWDLTLGPIINAVQSFFGITAAVTKSAAVPIAVTGPAIGPGVIPGMQTGGYVGKEGPYWLHAGEFVIPPGKEGIYQENHIYISGLMNEDLFDELMSKLERLLRRKAV